MFTIKEAKGNFFDRGKVMAAMDAATRKILARFGAFVRTTARRSMRRRKGTSAPGEPPLAHVGTIRNLLFFAAADRAVVIGPTLSNRPSGAPETLEYGGTVMLEEHRQVRGKRIDRKRRATIAKRPFMQPAFDTGLARMVPDAWANSIR